MFLVGAVFGYAGMFHRALHLPDWIELPFLFIFAACAWTGFLLQRRAKRRGDPSIVQTAPQHRARVKLALVLVVIVSLSSPFYLPYTGVNLPFPQLIICSVVSCAVCVAAVLIAARLRRPKA